MSIEEQLIGLEMRLTHQDKAIATLDEVVREFAARVEALERKLAGNADGGPDGGRPDEPPPHY